MPALSYPDQATIDSWNVREGGVKDGTSPTESFEVDNSASRRTFLVAWDSRGDFIKYMLGYGETWDDSGTTRLSRLLPSYHPEFTDLIASRVSEVRGLKYTAPAVPVDPDDPYRDDPAVCFDHPDYRFTDDDTAGHQINVFKDAVITVEYEQASFDRVEDADIYDGGSELDRYVVRGEQTPGAEYLQLPGAVFKYVRSSGTTSPHGKTIPFNNGLVLPQEKFVLVWRRVPSEVWTPDSALYEWVYGGPLYTVPALGCINDADFYGRPPGTVLFENVRPILRKSPLGVGFEWDLEYSFNYDPKGWNYKYYFGVGDPANNGWYFVSKGTTYYTPATLPDYESLYNARDLNNLFNVNL